MMGKLAMLSTLATIAAELAFVYWLWQQTRDDAPELDELAARVWREVESRAQYAEAIRRTLSSIRSLPETEGPE